jgi:hypothetical protein
VKVLVLIILKGVQVVVLVEALLIIIKRVVQVGVLVKVI